MIKKTITYDDLFEDRQVTIDAYFHLSKTMIIDLETEKEGGLSKFLETAVKSGDQAEILRQFKRIVVMAYGKREGGSFLQSEEISKAFLGSPAFDALFMSLLTDPKELTEFILGMIPKDLARDPGVVKALEQAGPRTIENIEDQELNLMTVRNTKTWPEREPTPQELRSMSREDLLKAMQRKMSPQPQAESE